MFGFFNGYKEYDRVASFQEMAVDIYLPGFNAWKNSDLVRNIDKLPYMKSMVLNGSGITDEGIELLSGCNKLRELHLVSTAVTDKGLKLISNLRSLDWLRIDEGEISDKGIRYLASLTNLDSLQIVNSNLSDDGLETLFHYPRLRYLETASDNISGKGLSIISQQNSIETLRLASRTIYDSEFLNLVFCRQLKSLTYDMPMVSRKAYEELNSRLPNCTINNYVHYSSKEKFNPLMLHVMELYLDNNFEYAMNAVQDAIKYNQKHPIVFAFRALIHLKLGSYFGFSDNMQIVYHLGMKYDDIELASLAKRYLKEENINSLQLLIAKERPENYFISTLNKNYKPRKRLKSNNYIILPNDLGPLLTPPPIQIPRQFSAPDSFAKRNEQLEEINLTHPDLEKQRNDRKGKGELPPWY